MNQPSLEQHEARAYLATFDSEVIDSHLEGNVLRVITASGNEWTVNRDASRIRCPGRPSLDLTELGTRVELPHLFSTDPYYGPLIEDPIVAPIHLCDDRTESLNENEQQRYFREWEFNEEERYAA